MAILPQSQIDNKVDGSVTASIMETEREGEGDRPMDECTDADACLMRERIRQIPGGTSEGRRERGHRHVHMVVTY